MVKGFGGYTIREAVPNPLKQTPAYMLANSVGNTVNSLKGSTRFSRCNWLRLRAGTLTRWRPSRALGRTCFSVTSLASE